MSMAKRGIVLLKTVSVLAENGAAEAINKVEKLGGFME